VVNEPIQVGNEWGTSGKRAITSGGMGGAEREKYSIVGIIHPGDSYIGKSPP